MAGWRKSEPKDEARKKAGDMLRATEKAIAEGKPFGMKLLGKKMPPPASRADRYAPKAARRGN